MPRAGQGHRAVAFIRAVTTTDEYNEPVENWVSPTTIATVAAQVMLGSSQENREAAQQSASQAASFICRRTPTLDTVTAKDRINFDGSQWGITERAPLSRNEIRFTATRVL
jgi:head-tail adaptor